MIGMVIILALVILAGIAMLASSLRDYTHYTRDSAGNTVSWPAFDAAMSNIDHYYDQLDDPAITQHYTSGEIAQLRRHAAEHRRHAAEIRREAPRPPLVALSAVILITTTSIALGLVLFFDEAAIFDISAAGATWTSAGVTNAVLWAIVAAIVYGIGMGAIMSSAGTSPVFPVLVGGICGGIFLLMTSPAVVATSTPLLAMFFGEIALACAWTVVAMVPATVIVFATQ